MPILRMHVTFLTSKRWAETSVSGQNCHNYNSFVDRNRVLRRYIVIRSKYKFVFGAF